jgi:hypothetical protein
MGENKVSTRENLPAKERQRPVEKIYKGLALK